jgi:transcriptional/translational regulatory protein YebC/TACO1
VDEIQFVPKTATPISGDDVATMEKLLDMLNDVEDVQSVYHDAVY